MNLRIGLERISAVWWALWGLAGLAFLATGLTQSTNGTGNVIAGIALLAGAYIAHRVTCWVVAGFFLRP